MGTMPRATAVVSTLLALNLLLVAASAVMQPAKLGWWAVALLPVGLMAAAWWGLPRRAPNDEARTRVVRSIYPAIIGASTMVAFALALKLGLALGLLASPDLPERGSMLLIGTLVVLMGNQLPKTLRPIAALRCSAAGTQALQRFAGWTFVLSGLAFSLAWLVLPVGAAETVSMLALATGTALVAAEHVRRRRSPSRTA
jgi:hypothetical protein